MKKNLKQRACERIELKVPALVRSSTSSNGKHHHLFLTRDISNQGAYFNTMEPETMEGPVEIEMVLEITGSHDQVNYVYMTTSGNIVRREERGLAVMFNDESRLMPFQIN